MEAVSGKENARPTTNQPSASINNEGANRTISTAGSSSPILHHVHANEAHERILAGTAEHGTAAAIGQFLVEEKATLGLQWVLWFNDHIEFSHSKAAEYVKAYYLQRGDDHSILPIAIYGPTIINGCST